MDDGGKKRQAEGVSEVAAERGVTTQAERERIGDNKFSRKWLCFMPCSFCAQEEASAPGTRSDSAAPRPEPKVEEAGPSRQEEAQEGGARLWELSINSSSNSSCSPTVSKRTPLACRVTLFTTHTNVLPFISTCTRYVR